MKKILISPSSFGQCGDEPLNILNSAGYEVINNPYGRKLTEREVIEIAKECIGIVAGVEPLTSTVMDSLPNLKCISRVGVGMDSVDLDYAKTKNIVVTNTPDGPSQAVAELTIGLTYSLLRKIPQAHLDIVNGRWNKQIGNLLLNKTIGVIGLGRIGKLTTQMFRALGNQVKAYDLYPDADWCNQNGVTIETLEDVLRNSDIVCIHIPGSKDKSPVITEEHLKFMQPSSFLINVSRGGVVDEEVLLNYLTDNKIAGAAIDVFSDEPYSGPFTQLKNVVLTPHLGSYASEGKLKMEVDAVNNLINILKNE
jgi:D-3-phosphoglycerate dehydrogenase